MGNRAFGQPLKLARAKPLDEALQILVETWVAEHSMEMVSKKTLATIQDRVQQLEEEAHPDAHRCDRVIILEKRLEEVTALQKLTTQQGELIIELKRRLDAQINVKVSSRCSHAAILETARDMTEKFFFFLGAVARPREGRVQRLWREAVDALEAFDKFQK